jgi:hypothetical protein
MVDEVTYGTAVTVTRFVEYDKESVTQDIERIESKGLRPNRRVLATDDWLPGRIGCNGPVEFEWQNKGMGLILKHMLGTIASSQPSAGPDPTVWEHTAKVGALDGKMFTSQIGRTGVDGTTRAFTYAGCKIPEWELSCDSQGILTLKATVDAQSESTAVALASASYAAAVVPLVYVGGTLSIGGVATDVYDYSLKASNSLKLDRYFMRGAATGQLKKEPLEGDKMREYSGELKAEFTDLTLYNKYVNGTVGSLTSFFAGAIISNSFRYALEITHPAVRFDGKTPNVDGPGIIEQSLPFKCLDDGSATTPVQMLYRTTDTTP